MSQIKEELFYTREHEWVRIAGNQAYIGITDFAQSELGDIVFTELPGVGVSITAGETFGTVESVKTVSDLYAPVSGRVVQVNEELADSPEKVNADPYGSGWMIVVELADPENREGLLSAAEYRAHIGE